MGWDAISGSPDDRIGANSPVQSSPPDLSAFPVRDYPVEALAQHPDGGRRRVAWVALCALAIVGAVALVGRSSWSTADRPGTSTIREPIGLGAPTDGKASLLLPVRVTPDRDLIDGQQVTVTAANFRPGRQVGAVMCTLDARTRGAAACDLFRVVATGTVGPDGRVSIPYTIRRFPIIDNQPYDCMQGNVDPVDYEARLVNGDIPTPDEPGWTSCIIAVGELDDYDQSGGWPVSLNGATIRRPGEPPPETTATTGTVPGAPVPGGTAPGGTAPDGTDAGGPLGTVATTTTPARPTVTDRPTQSLPGATVTIAPTIPFPTTTTLVR